jgi:hypothetical protein
MSRVLLILIVLYIIYGNKKETYIRIKKYKLCVHAACVYVCRCACGFFMYYSIKKGLTKSDITFARDIYSFFCFLICQECKTSFRVLEFSHKRLIIAEHKFVEYYNYFTYILNYQ